MQTLQTKTADNLEQLTESLEQEALRQQKAEEEREKIKALEQDGIDGFTNTKLTLVPSPNFTEATSVGTYLPVNMADETVTFLSQLNRKYDFIDFIKEKLGYKSRIKVAQCFASEQLDALVMAINCFEKNNAFILGDMAGIGKGRVCAGAMRYAYQRGLIPIFVTHKPYLFDNINGDFNDIDGLGVDANGNEIKIKPLVLHQDGLVYEVDKYGNEVIDPVTGEKVIAFSALKSKEMNKLLAEQTLKIKGDEKLGVEGMGLKEYTTPGALLPEGYNAVFLPYSTIGQTKGRIKQDFLEAIAPRSIIVFDESHNAASANAEAKILRMCTPLVESSEGVLFSSATYAKSPAVFNLYVIKTALRTAVPTLESITNALKVGGENVSEYIATGLVREGQMIRRERSFSVCNKVTEYVGQKRTEVNGKVIHTDDPNDNQKQFFNEAIGYFKSLRDFAKDPFAKLAIRDAILRECANKKFDLVDSKEVEDIKEYLSNAQETDAVKKASRDSWIAKHRGKYLLSYSEDNISRYKTTFRENLFLAIKAKFTADLVIECLNKEVEYTNVDGTTHLAPMKPIIAMKSTGASIFSELDLQLNQTLKNDFSEYLLSIYRKIFAGTFEVRKVDSNFFETEAELLRQNIKPAITFHKYDVLMTDFFDTPNGLDAMGNPTARQRIIKIQNSLNAYNSQIPFSIIDYLRYRIESTPRSSVYFKPGTFEAKYGEAQSQNYIMLEGTAREEMLVKMNLNDPNSLYVFKKNDRPERITDIFNAFNNGRCDVMLINAVASTGGSAQSNPKWSDPRPRNMFMIQTELDVNIEVQKRGRINRTGQINNPTYTYVVTQIPVEQRLYLMFRKKLRKLDANTSANQSASAEANELPDKDGNPIEDIFNPYGYDVFMDSFINVPAFSLYKEIYDSLNWRAKKGAQSSGQATTAAQSAAATALPAPGGATPVAIPVVKNVAGGAQDEQNYEAFNAFTRELELYPVNSVFAQGQMIAVGQDTFFDEMQRLYRNYVADLKQKGEYQLELIARDYKAVLKQQSVVQENAGTSTFSSCLFLSDYFTLNDRKIWSIDRVNQKVAELAEKMDPTDFHIALVKDFEMESKIERFSNRKVYEQYNEPKRADFPTDDAYNTADIVYNKNLGNYVNGMEASDKYYSNIIRFFTPKKQIYYNGNPGLFVGYNIRNPMGRYKYSPALVEFVFVFLQGYTTLKFNLTGAITSSAVGLAPSDQNSQIAQLNSIIINTQVYLEGNTVQAMQLRDQITAWKPDPWLRMVKRFYTGNILSGIIKANEERAKGGPSWQLTRFTNIDGSLTTAVQLNVDSKVLERAWQNTVNIALSVNAGSPRFIKYLQEMPISNSINSSVTSNFMAKANTEYTMAIFNLPSPKLIESEKYADRAIAIVKTQMEKKNVYYPIINFFVLQNYAIGKDGKAKDIVPYLKGSQTLFPARWNFLYHDDNFSDDFNDYYEKLGRMDIKYATKYTEERDRSGKVTGQKPELDKYPCLVKKFSFNLLIQKDLDDLQVFLDRLSNQYQVNFNFRSSAADYLNTAELKDVPKEQLAKDNRQTFEKADYVYQFVSNPKANIESDIPDLKERRAGGQYGQIVTTQPLTPTQCFTFKLIPFEIPDNIVYVKMALATLNDIDKATFIQELETKAKNFSPDDVGAYVERFLSTKSVPYDYFFGYMDLFDVGTLFQDYALKKDISKLISSAAEKSTKAPLIPKDKVTFEDAERFLMFLNP
jgi:hypothetical protein